MHLESGKRLTEVINCKTLAKFTIFPRARAREILPKASDSRSPSSHASRHSIDSHLRPSTGSANYNP